jgi:hypothetical protein
VTRELKHQLLSEQIFVSYSNVWQKAGSIMQIAQVEQNGTRSSKHRKDVRVPESSVERIVDALLHAQPIAISGGILSAVVVVAALAGACVCSLLRRQ